mmetsp:Transcript_12116/g.45075  ORF Transcript_12116/g.45075 Transcript_12116/m.45075 type:complete len:358 (-) Transcript_12116:2822-3895(-)
MASSPRDRRCCAGDSTCAAAVSCETGGVGTVTTVSKENDCRRDRALFVGDACAPPENSGFKRLPFLRGGFSRFDDFDSIASASSEAAAEEGSEFGSEDGSSKSDTSECTSENRRERRRPNTRSSSESPALDPVLWSEWSSEWSECISRSASSSESASWGRTASTPTPTLSFSVVALTVLESSLDMAGSSRASPPANLAETPDPSFTNPPLDTAGDSRFTGVPVRVLTIPLNAPTLSRRPDTEETGAPTTATGSSSSSVSSPSWNGNGTSSVARNIPQFVACSFSTRKYDHAHRLNTSVNATTVTHASAPKLMPSLAPGTAAVIQKCLNSKFKTHAAPYFHRDFIIVRRSSHRSLYPA